MSTCAMIAVKLGEGEYIATRVNFDADPSLGNILVQHHDSLIQAIELVEGGEVRGIDENGDVEYYDGSKMPLKFESLRDAVARFGDHDYFYQFNNEWVYRENGYTEWRKCYG